MYYSGYDHITGCDNFFINDTYKDVECMAMMTVKYWWFFVGLVGSFMHTYVLFCYILNRESHKDTIDTLIIALSFFDLINCIGLTVTSVLNSLPIYYDAVECFVSSIFLPFYRWAIEVIQCRVEELSKIREKNALNFQKIQRKKLTK